MHPIACRFFFSSRRRHTRFDCDWSSDVCSSDLGIEQLAYLLELAFDRSFAFRFVLAAGFGFGARRVRFFMCIAGKQQVVARLRRFVPRLRDFVPGLPHLAAGAVYPVLVVLQLALEALGLTFELLDAVR